MKPPFPLPYSSFTVKTSLPVGEVERRLRADTVPPLSRDDRSRFERDWVLRWVDGREVWPRSDFEGTIARPQFALRSLRYDRGPRLPVAFGAMTSVESGAVLAVTVEPNPTWPIWVIVGAMRVVIVSDALGSCVLGSLPFSVWAWIAIGRFIDEVRCVRRRLERLLSAEWKE